jgi:hypothetical protein
MGQEAKSTNLPKQYLGGLHSIILFFKIPGDRRSLWALECTEQQVMRDVWY